MAEQDEWRLQSGQYLGETSALCFLHLPSHLHSLPYLLAGMGSQMLLYNLESGNMIRTFQVFEGIRVHGIFCRSVDCTEGSPASKIAFEIAVFGERRVKMFRLHIELVSGSKTQSEVCMELILFRVLPKFNHWVLDVCFLKDNVVFSLEGSCSLAVGCSDNSVSVWDVRRCSVILEVKCPERCLLYSMRLWGDEVEALRIASGTIYNEIVVWKVVPQNYAPSLTSPVKSQADLSGSVNDSLNLHGQGYEALHICRLSGHEGSIFRIAWSKNGSKLVSVSDDRCARIWDVYAENRNSDSQVEVVGPVLTGHSARVWDCCIFDSFIVTAGEDCTCRVWRPNGDQITMIKEHIGRGIWRCLYDLNSSLLVTAGFDSSIKVHLLHASLSTHPDGYNVDAKEFIDKSEVFTLQIPNSSAHFGLTDSKSEYVRSLRFTSEDTLYVATNNGYLYHAKLSDTRNVKWTELVRVSEEVPIVCMDLLLGYQSELSSGIEDWVAVGDGNGSVTIVRVINNACTPKVALTFTWSAGTERQLLGTYWCKSLGNRHIFTADPRGMLKFWRLCDPSLSASQNFMKSCSVSLVAEFMSSLMSRIMCLDASFEKEVLVCGDLRGNMVLFPFVKSLLLGTSVASEVKISPLNYFKGAHGISNVSSISIARYSSNQIEIRSTGGDGCICYMEYDSDLQNLDFVGMKQVKELSLIQAVSADTHSVDDLASGTYAIGFASANFIIWNLMTETKVVQIPCGGWRRPHSYYLGDIPEMKNCFAYVKDEIIHIRRHWVSDSERKIFPQNLHMQFHGREIHSLSFVSEDLQCSADGNSSLFPKSTSIAWIATGCEDGTVRLTRYTPGVENWSASRLLGEHVGGSAVRSICSASKIHVTATENMTKWMNGHNAVSEESGNPFLLISVGAKRVLTSWLLRNGRLNNKEEALGDERLEVTRNGGFKPSSGVSSSPSFKWLSTDMPTKRASSHKKAGKIEKLGMKNDTSSEFENKEMELKTCHENDDENDWRYLAVTAFLVKHVDSRLIICFVVVACSDATLMLRALILPYRFWFDVALLIPIPSPVLALQHVIVPCEEKSQIKNVYLVISGSTDGSMAFWDLTQSVEAFIQQLSTLHIENYIDPQKRPRTGRGSQGGRWWKSLRRNVSKQTPAGDSVVDPENGTLEEDRNDDLSCEICEIRPVHVLTNVHQSGINCLHVSEDCQSSGFVYKVISGGDDQALHYLGFDLQSEDYRIRFLYQERVASAHSSAIKGVWTDGIWVFSVGLDQRVRCWDVDGDGDGDGKLNEHGHLIISVPEPEALDARSCGRKRYQIAVAGRGMQMVEFNASSDMDGVD